MKHSESTPHPGPEVWSAFLYDELSPEETARLHDHLETCPECQAHVERWRQTMSALDTWHIAAPRQAMPWFQPALKWAAAAVLLLGLGVAAGRLTVRVPDATALREQLAPVLRAQLRQELLRDLDAGLQTASDRTDRQLQDLAQAWAAGREEDRKTVLALYARAELQRKSENAALRRDLETVAVNAQTGLTTTQAKLGELYAYSEALYERPDAINPANPR